MVVPTVRASHTQPPLMLHPMSRHLCHQPVSSVLSQLPATSASFSASVQAGPVRQLHSLGNQFPMHEFFLPITEAAAYPFEQKTLGQS